MSEFEYSAGTRGSNSSPQPRTAARLASAWRACRAKTVGRPSSWSIASDSRRP
ncbi:MAG TPA: hypothetical protein VFN45_10115 [Myxococcaceae bacterium]|nr:hypothetical protein [Myxococcaceae bacterium]